jgi:hypothetical protein
MALNHSPKIVTEGLVFAYDMGNGKSNIGAPVTNLLPTPAINGYPTTGNGWGTYNTNQYGSGTYFSIGTVSSVSDNIVTMTAPHSLRTYDVMQPQTTGGGVTAATNYFIKKISDTQFSLHAYNSSQDGSQGYVNPFTGMFKVHDSIALDQRVSINSTSFPTMWWGYPHLANSGLVKEIISKGFNGIPGRAATDCIRLHYIRNEGLDGMAYGVDATVTAGTPHTVSFWARAASVSAVGLNNSYSIYNYGVTSPTNPSWNFTLGAFNEWKKYYFTFTPNNPSCISYWFPASGNMKYDISNIQFEAGSVANNFAAGTRSNTQAIIDQTGNNTITANSLTYAADGTFSFNGSSNYIDCGNGVSLQQASSITMAAWVNPVSASGLGNVMSKNQNSGYRFRLDSTSNALWWYVSGNSVQGGECPNNVWSYCAVTGDSSGLKAYVNGQLVASNTTPFSPSAPTGGNLLIGSLGGAEFFNGKIGSAFMYNRALTAAEVKQNFNALRGRFGI